MENTFRFLTRAKAKIRDNRWNVLGLLVGMALWFYGAWQLDLLASPYVWADVHTREILPFWFWPSTWAYVLFFTWLTVGYFLSVASLLLAFRRMRFYLSKLEK